MKKHNCTEIIICTILLLISIGAICTSIYACANYGGKPVTEIPAWALMFMFGGGK